MLRLVRLRLTGPDRPFVERPITDGPRAGEVQRIPIGPSNAFVRCVFSRGDWGLNGRFYGGWWQQIDRHLRNHIYIDNQPTVEVDFRGLHVAILSKERGVPLQDDPYELPEGTLPETTAIEQREIVKKLILTAINAKTEKAAYYAFRDGWSTGSKGKSLTNVTLASVLVAFLRKYPHLEGCLCSDQGIRLMNFDSRIAAEVLSYFTGEGTPVLCVHDSFIINHTRTLELIKVMDAVTTRFLGGPLRVSQDYPGIDQFMRHPDNRPAAYWRFRNLPRPTPGYLHRQEKFWERGKMNEEGLVN